jgi:hypothetical protein
MRIPLENTGFFVLREILIQKDDVAGYFTPKFLMLIVGGILGSEGL